MSVECTLCSRKVHDLRGLVDHTKMIHGEDVAEAMKADIRQADRRRKAEELRQSLREKARVEARAKRTVVLSTADIDDIIGEMESLIRMMEPYYAQANAYEDAEALIRRLEALADGKMPAPQPPAEPPESLGDGK